MATRNPTYGASAALTITLASLGSSATLVAGAESNSVDNNSNVSLDEALGGNISVGTSPTANTQIEVWVVPRLDDTIWPDVFDGTGSAETVSSRDALQAAGRLAALITVPVTTSSVAYPFFCGSIAALFGGTMPKSYVVFVTHNTGVALHATAGNHFISRTPVKESIA